MSGERPPKSGHRWFAASYDIMTKPGEKRLGVMRDRLLGGLNGDVLEIGAGTGANFARYPRGVRVVAFEPDPHMLKRAQKRLLELGRSDIDVRPGAAEQLPVEDATFDAVVSTLVLCTVDDPPRALGEINRVLRPGAAFHFIEHVRGDGLLGRAQGLAQPAWGWCSAGCHINRNTESLLAAAGFETTSIERSKLAPWMPLIAGAATFAR